MAIADLPLLNAVLNSGSAVFLLSGYYLIRKRKIRAHRACMLSAFVTSTLFLISYVIYHYSVGSVRFTGEGAIRTLYFIILVSHTLLAVTVPFLSVLTLVRALRARFDMHKAIARWSLPVWLYVSVTGVTIYIMLYKLYPAG